MAKLLLKELVSKEGNVMSYRNLARRIGNITKIQKHAEYYLEPQIKEDVAIVENKK
jgi:hypothetical protein